MVTDKQHRPARVGEDRNAAHRARTDARLDEQHRPARVGEDRNRRTFAHDWLEAGGQHRPARVGEDRNIKTHWKLILAILAAPARQGR